MKVSVSILKELNNYKKAIEKVNNSNADYLHLDIMDGSFTENSSFSIDNFRDININKKIDVHLMSKNLDKLIDEYTSLNPQMITFHLEVGDTLNYIKKIKEKNIKVGLAINPNTNLSDALKYLDLIDYLLIMSVHPGFGGQKIIEDSLDKIKYLKDMRDKFNYKYLIEIDGGVNIDNLNNVCKVGTDIIVAGSSIFNGNIYENISNFNKILKEYNE